MLIMRAAGGAVMENSFFGARLKYGWDATSARMNKPIDIFLP
jgi:hypothetical protein